MRRILFSVDDIIKALDTRLATTSRHHLRHHRPSPTGRTDRITAAGRAPRNGAATAADSKTTAAGRITAADRITAAGRAPQGDTAATTADLKTASDRITAVEQALLFCDEHRVIQMQGGLSLFRSAMTLRMKDGRKGRYTNADYEPLHEHYEQKIFQVHAIGRYVEQHSSGGNPRGYVWNYFRMTQKQFQEEYFPDDLKALQRPVDADQHERIVTQLMHPEQERIVTAPRDRNMLILAGPGSGKTKVVVHRAAYLLTVEQIPPRRILMICFNRAAAHELRIRLRDLVGETARGVDVHTYHSLALRLAGRSLASERSSGLTPDEAVDFGEVIRDANRMLAGDGTFVGHDADTLRDQLLAGYEYVLVDEYQDIDQNQYTMLTYIARRAGGDSDTHAAILAVGDDDQSIYEWRGANTELIRRFQDEFDAESHHLVENYRSTPNIITVANRLIAHNTERVKKDHPIRVNASRANDPAGGDWEHLDKHTKGRVLLLEVADGRDEPPRIAAQIERIKRLRPEHEWTDFAVLARSQDQADTNRAFLESKGIPVRWAVRRRAGQGDSPQRSLPWLGRIREFRRLYAGGKPARHPIHKTLRALYTGSNQIRLQVRKGRLHVVETHSGRIIAKLSKEASVNWRDELDTIEDIRILGLVQRKTDDSSPEYRDRLKKDTWEVPIMEIRQRLP